MIFIRLWHLVSLRMTAEAAMKTAHEEVLPDPWLRESPLTRELCHDKSCNGKSRFHKMDMWHGFHLGIGKAWVACALMLCQKVVVGPTIDERFKVISTMYSQFCKTNRLDKIISKVDKHICGGGGSAEPVGTWSKAAVTTNLCLFLEFFFSVFWENCGWQSLTAPGILTAYSYELLIWGLFCMCIYMSSVVCLFVCSTPLFTDVQTIMLSWFCCVCFCLYCLGTWHFKDQPCISGALSPRSLDTSRACYVHCSWSFAVY